MFQVWRHCGSRLYDPYWTSRRVLQTQKHKQPSEELLLHSVSFCFLFCIFPFMLCIFLFCSFAYFYASSPGHNPSSADQQLYEKKGEKKTWKTPHINPGDLFLSTAVTVNNSPIGWLQHGHCCHMHSVHSVYWPRCMESVLVSLHR